MYCKMYYVGCGIEVVKWNTFKVNPFYYTLQWLHHNYQLLFSMKLG